MSGNLAQRHGGKIAVGGGVAAAIALAVPFIVAWEGNRNDAYLDSVRIATVCVGHIEGVKLGDHKTNAECNTILAGDLQRTASGIAPCIRVPVPTESYAAFVSFSFNVGVRGFCGSSVARKLNSGDLKGACAGLSAWDYAGGHRIKGLTRRRAAERALCERGL